ncbi:GatB/YqeY domain-containing protein [Fulvimonas yonginensis]|uniref:GatB/YqeY domain-containing protein n=1 Tax=Fulvimonas yonginensis TaxID=1495200 RepID=A0ABU8JCF4_9GAMM
MSLKQRITDDMKAAMRGGEKERLGVIRLMLAAIKQREVDERIELDAAQTLAVLEKMLKQRRDSVSQFEAAGREDLAAVERAEMAVIEGYLPAKLDDAELDALIDEAITQTGASSARDMGKVVGAVKRKAAGRADMAQVSARIKARLGG